MLMRFVKSLFCLYLILSQCDWSYLLKRLLIVIVTPVFFFEFKKSPYTVSLCQCSLLLWTNTFYSSIVWLASAGTLIQAFYVCSKLTICLIRDFHSGVNFDKQWIKWINLHSILDLYNKFSIQLMLWLNKFIHYIIYFNILLQFSVLLFPNYHDFMSCHQSLPLLPHWSIKWLRWAGGVSHYQSDYSCTMGPRRGRSTHYCSLYLSLIVCWACISTQRYRMHTICKKKNDWTSFYSRTFSPSEHVSIKARSEGFFNVSIQHHLCSYSFLGVTVILIVKVLVCVLQVMFFPFGCKCCSIHSTLWGLSNTLIALPSTTVRFAKINWKYFMQPFSLFPHS